MTRPAKWQAASAEELWQWFMADHPIQHSRELFAALRDEVAREVREESDKTIESLRADNLRLLMERVDILALSNPTEN